MIAVLLLVSMLPGPPSRGLFLHGCLRGCQGYSPVRVCIRDCARQADHPWSYVGGGRPEDQGGNP